jgi:hypothetical protein
MDRWPTFGDGNLDANPDWRNYVDETIACFMAALPSELRGQLDYSAASLSLIDRWIVDRYSDLDALVEHDDFYTCVYKGVILYVGEIYRKYLGGYWIVGQTEVGKGPILEGFHKNWRIAVEDDVSQAIDDGIEVWIRQKLEAMLKRLAIEK